MECLPLASAKPLAPCPLASSQLRRQPLLPSCLPAAPASGRTASRRVRFRVLAHGRGSGRGPSQRFSPNEVHRSFGSELGTTYLKQYAMKRAMTTMMEQMASGNSNFKNSGFSPSSPYPFPSAPFPPPPASSPVPGTSRPVTTIDVASAEVEATTTIEVRSDTDKTSERPRRYAFVDVSAEEISQKDPSTDAGIAEKGSSKEISDSSNEVSSNGSAVKEDQNPLKEQSEPRNAASVLSVDALEKMMEDPTVQKMSPRRTDNKAESAVRMRNPQYRQQLQDMLNNMGGSSDWDNRIMDSMKNFDLSSPEVKQQFDQIGLTPEDVISKIMANPELALAFQNPKVQAAIMDCSQNPFSIAKYQNDKEVMDVFNKISELFPGVTGGTP
ncbi:hypothetical protein Taro_003432 [Colocasia esculenta]|uniref:Protein TIC 40, chloroplastic n=1 Tax=Colocasia esculenta TaxID=4460 RepID=A0A843TM73_COLES|nr:hypothetical protein [Colocasia esculenta]